MATFTESGGGSLAALVARHAIASTATEINQVVLGSGPLGPQPFAETGGGSLAATGLAALPPGSFTLSGGGSLAATATITVSPHGTFTLSGGGALASTGHASSRGFVLSGGGAHFAAIGVSGPVLVLQAPCAVVEISAAAPLLGTPPPVAPAPLLVSLVDDTLEVSPGTLVAFVGNGTPGGIANFYVTQGMTSVEVLIAQFDESGALGGISVPVEVTAEGTYGLLVTDVTESISATAPFSVASVSTALTIGVPVVTPPTTVQPGTGVKKWVFQDTSTSDVYHFAINPNKMNSPHAPKRITFTATTAIDGASLAFEGRPLPVEWQFEGTLFDKAQYDAFAYWTAKRNRIWLTDHFGRAWLVYLTHFDPSARRAVNHPWAHDYRMTALIFDGPVNPA